MVSQVSTDPGVWVIDFQGGASAAWLVRASGVPPYFAAVFDSVLPNVVATLVGAAVLFAIGVFGFRRKLLALWDRRPGRIGRAPRTPQETRRLLARRPPGWEYLLVAGAIYQETEKHAARYRDHLTRYVTPSDAIVTDDEVEGFLEGERTKIMNIVDNWSNMLNGPALTRALGEPGESGIPEDIAHLADRMGGTYVQVMDWAARLRGSRHPMRYRRIFDIVAQFIDAPVETIAVTLTLDIPGEVMDAYERERQRLVRGDPDPDDD